MNGVKMYSDQLKSISICSGVNIISIKSGGSVKY